VLVTSNAHAWRGLAEPVQVRLWPTRIGADYLIVRTGDETARDAAEALSESLGGLPLAHEQAAAYCERLDISLAEYHRRFAATPTRLLADQRHAPAEYHDGWTVAKTFGLAIEEASKLHEAAEPLIAYAAQLAPEPLPLFVFVEGRESLGEPLASGLAGEGLDEAIAALRAFALIDRESIVDERDPAVTTPTIRLHRLVREVAAERRGGAARDAVRRSLIKALAGVYPEAIFDDPKAWIRARRLDPLALALVGPDAELPAGMEERAGYLLNGLAAYRHGALGAYAQARPLRELSLAFREKALGARHPDTAESLNNLALTLQDQGELARAQPLHQRALAIREQALGPEHPDTAVSLNNLALLLHAKGDCSAGVPLLERVLAINEKAHGAEHPDTARALNNLGFLLHANGDVAAARRMHERALAIREQSLGSEHPHTASSLNNLALVLRSEGNLASARLLFDRALAIREKSLGAEHPHTAATLNHLALLLQADGNLAGAEPLFERALAIRRKVLGNEHPSTAQNLANLALLLQARGDLARAWPLLESALQTCESVLGHDHADTVKVRDGLARCGQASRPE
jgi:Tfp pilus assembly protein PilF